MSDRVPITGWLPTYRREWLRTDVVAGATVWAVLIPSALAYAGIVGVDPIVGLYTVPLALAAYAALGSSRLLVVGPDAAISVLAAATIAPIATGDDYLELVLALSLIVGGVYVILHVLRMGWIADLVPDPVLRGFIQGLVWVTILDQVPKLLGFQVDDANDDFWRRFVDFARELGDTQAETAWLGVGSVVALFALKRFVPSIPGPLVVLVATVGVVVVFDLADTVAVVGEPEGALFDIGVPSGVSGAQVVDLLPGALAIVVLGFTESMGAAKTAAQKTGERLDPNQELLAIGAANVGAGISGGYVVTGALSKTSVAIASGGRTQIVNVVAGVLGVLSILVLRPVFAELALTVLAAIVVFAMAGMANLAYFRSLWRVSRTEFVIALVAFLGVLTFGVLPGVVIAVALSLVLLVGHIGNPPSAVLGRTSDGAWRALDRSPEAMAVPGIVVWRQEAPLVFLNARRLGDRLRSVADDPEVELIVADASVTTGIDSTALGEFLVARQELLDRGVDLWLVSPLVRIEEKTRLALSEAGASMPKVFATVDDAVAEFERTR